MKYGELKKVIDPDLGKDEIDICWKCGETLKWFELDETDGKYRTPKVLTLSKNSDDEIMLSNPCYTIVDLDNSEVKMISAHGSDYDNILRITLEQDTKLSFELNKVSMPYICDIEELSIDSPDVDYTKMKQTSLNNVEDLYLTDVRNITDALYAKEIKPKIQVGIKDMFFHDMIRELSFIISISYWYIKPDDNGGYNLHIPSVNLVLPIMHPETVKICSVSLGYDGTVYFSVKIDRKHMEGVFDHVEYTAKTVDQIPMKRGTLLGKFVAHDFTYDDSWRWK